MFALRKVCGGADCVSGFSKMCLHRLVFDLSDMDQIFWFNAATSWCRLAFSSGIKESEHSYKTFYVDNDFCLSQIKGDSWQNRYKLHEIKIP